MKILATVLVGLLLQASPCAAQSQYGNPGYNKMDAPGPPRGGKGNGPPMGGPRGKRKMKGKNGRGGGGGGGGLFGNLWGGKNSHPAMKKLHEQEEMKERTRKNAMKKGPSQNEPGKAPKGNQQLDNPNDPRQRPGQNMMPRQPPRGAKGGPGKGGQYGFNDMSVLGAPMKGVQKNKSFNDQKADSSDNIDMTEFLKQLPDNHPYKTAAQGDKRALDYVNSQLKPEYRQQFHPKYMATSDAKKASRKFFGNEALDAKAIILVDDSNFDNFVTENKKTFVMFYAPWSSESQEFKQAFIDASTAVIDAQSGDDLGVFAAIDCHYNYQTCGSLAVKELPSFKLFEEGRYVTDYVGEATSDSVLSFLLDPENAELSEVVDVAKEEEEESPAEMDDGQYRQLHPFYDRMPSTNVVRLGTERMAGSFDAFLNENAKMFVMFHAPWCPHSYQAKPEVIRLSEILAKPKTKEVDLGVQIASVDCSMNKDLCVKFNINSLPTFKFFAGHEDSPVKDVMDYTPSGRDVRSFLQFLQQVSNLDNQDAAAVASGAVPAQKPALPGAQDAGQHIYNPSSDPGLAKTGNIKPIYPQAPEVIPAGSAAAAQAARTGAGSIHPSANIGDVIDVPGRPGTKGTIVGFNNDGTAKVQIVVAKAEEGQGNQAYKSNYAKKQEEAKSNYVKKLEEAANPFG